MANEFKVKKGLIVQGSGTASPVLDVQGSQGQLFSVTDQLTGSLFSVNDISGMPIIEAFSDGTVKLGYLNTEAIIISGTTSRPTIKSPIINTQLTGDITPNTITPSNRIVSETGTQSLTNKTISGVNNTITNIGTTSLVDGSVTNVKLANMTQSTIKGRSSVGTGVPEDLTAAQVRTILNVADGSTANQTDTYLLNRDNHTGTQSIATIQNLQTELNNRSLIGHTHSLNDISGLTASLALKADLVGGLVPASQLPSYVDDVLEYGSTASFPVTGETGKIYTALDTNKIYRWSGSTYIYITSGAVDTVNGQTGVVVLTTTNINEGTNLYYTDTRVGTYVSTAGITFSNKTISGTNNTITNIGTTSLVNNSVTNVKLGTMSQNTIKGRSTGTGDVEDLTAAQVRTILNVADGSTANQTDTYLLNRDNHTGTQSIATIQNLQPTLDGKSNVGHTHSIAEVQNLQSTLDGKSNIGHTHSQTDILGLTSSLASKSNVGHTHSLTQILSADNKTTLPIIIDDGSSRTTYTSTSLANTKDGGTNSTTLIWEEPTSNTTLVLPNKNGIIATIGDITGGLPTGEIPNAFSTLSSTQSIPAASGWVDITGVSGVVTLASAVPVFVTATYVANKSGGGMQSTIAFRIVTSTLSFISQSIETTVDTQNAPMSGSIKTRATGLTASTYTFKLQASYVSGADNLVVGKVQFFVQAQQAPKGDDGQGVPLGGATNAVLVKNTAGDYDTTWKLLTPSDVGAQPLLTNPVTGIGTINYLPKFGTTSSIVNSQVFDNGTNVGIGTITPSHKLEVSGNMLVSQTTYFQNTSNWIDVSSGLRLRSDSNGINFAPNGTQIVKITATGIGINTTTPSERLHVVGNSLISGTMTATTVVKSGGTSNQFLKADGSIDSSTYLTTGTASSTYLPLTGGTITGNLGVTGTFSASIPALGSTATTFLTHTSGLVQSRTSAQVLTDIGAQPLLTNPVTGTGSTNFISKWSGSTTQVNSQVFDNGTNVGIGTTNPVGRIHAISNAGTDTKVVVAANYNVQHSAAGSMFEATYTRGTEATPAGVVTGDTVNVLSFRTAGSVGNLFTNPSFAIRSTIGSVIGSALAAVDTSFMVNTTATGTPFAALTLQGQTGNVGVGTTNPLYKLHVDGSAYFSGTNQTVFYDGATRFGASLGYGYNTIINNVGSIGVNTLTPSEKLHVIGNSLISGTMTAGTFSKIGGLSTQFLKADGSVDSNTYLTTGTASSTYLPLAGGTLTGPLTTQDLTITGTLLVSGTTSTVNSTTVTVKDPIITLGGNTPPVSNDAKDRGVEFRYFDTSAKVGFFGMDDTDGRFKYFINATNTSEVFSGTLGTAEFGTVIATTFSATSLTVSNITALGSTASVFLTHTGGLVQSRTSAQVLSDIGAQTALTNPVTGTGSVNFISKWNGTTTQANSQIFDNGTNVGIGTSTPTHTLTLPSTSTGWVHYNTVDQTTNFERIRGHWSANTYVLGTEQGGSAPSRNIQLRTTSRAITILNDGPSFIDMSNGTAIADRNQVTISPAVTPSSGISKMLILNPTINQSGTAGFTGLEINPTITTTGSGVHKLIDVKWGGSERFNILSSGNVGIGITTPTEKLHVVGNALLTGTITASISALGSTASTFLTHTGGLVQSRTSAQVLTDIGAQAELTNPVTGTGSNNFITKWNGTTTQTNSQIFDNGTNVSISSTSSVARFNVKGSGTSSSTNTVSIVNSLESNLFSVRDDGRVDMSKFSFQPTPTFSTFGPGSELHFGNNWTALSGTNRFDIYFPGQQIFFTNLSTIFQSSLNINRVGDATGTATQRDSFSNVFQTSLWNGSSSVLTYNAIRSIASTTVNQEYRLGFRMGTDSAGGSGGLETLSLLNTGNIGMGTTAPTEKLHVVGNALLTGTITASISALGSTASTFLTHTAGLVQSRTSAQVLTDIGAQAALTNPTTGTGSVNFITKWNGTTTQTNSQLFDNGTNVGINTSTPDSKMEIRGADGSIGDGILNVSTTNTQLKMGGSTTFSWVQSFLSKPLYINPLGNATILNRDAGNVGIGTTTPAEKLHVFGNALLTGTITASISALGSTASTFLTHTGGLVQSRTAAQVLTDIGAQAALTNPTTGTGSNNFITKWNGTTTQTNSQIFDDGTNVGIGTSTPVNKLQVNSGSNYVALDSYGGFPAIKTNGSVIRIMDRMEIFGRSGARYFDVRNDSETQVIKIDGLGDSFFNAAGNLFVGSAVSIGSEKLQVTGGIRATGTILTTSGFNGNLITNGGELRLDTSNLRFRDTYPLLWSSTSDANGTKDLGLRRASTGLLEIYDGITPGTYRDLIARTVTATTIVKSGGTSSQFLKADGSVDSNTYLTTGAASGTYLPLAGGTLTGTLVTQDITINGTLLINGTTSTVNSTTVTVKDPIITLGGNTAPTSNDAKDRGVEFRYYDSVARVGFFGMDDTDKRFKYFINATNTSEVFSGTLGTAEFGSVIAASFSGSLNESDVVFSDITTGNATVSKHGFLRKLSGSTIQFLRGDGEWSTVTSANDGLLTMNVSGNGLSGTATFSANTTANPTFTVTSNATSSNTSSTIVFRDGSGNFSAGTITASLSGNATTATTSTNLVGGNATTLLGSIPYQSNTNITTLLAPNTTTNKRFLTMTGTGTNGAGPTWSAVNDVDVVFTDNTTGNATTGQHGYLPKLVGGTSSFLRADGTWATVDVPTVTVKGELVSGVVDGFNNSFTLSATPSNYGIIATINGVVRHPSIDYSISGKTITFNFAPKLNSEIFVYYNVVDSSGGGGGGGIHTHTISDVIGLSTELDNKSNIGHTHSQSDILGLTSSLANKVNGGGTVSYVPRFTGIDTIGNSQIYDTGTNVGIGTITPTEKLYVEGNLSVSSPGPGGNGCYFPTSGNAYVSTQLRVGNGLRINALNIDTTFSNDFTVFTNKMTFKNNGAFLINQTTDDGVSKMQMTGNLKVNSGDIEVSDSVNGVVLKSPNGTRYRLTVDNNGILTTTAI